MLGSSSRLICRFTNNSKDTSGTKSAGRGPCRKKKITDTRRLDNSPAIPPNERTWLEFGSKEEKSGEAHSSIADGGEDIKLSQSSQGVNGLQSTPKGLMEYVTDPSTPAAGEEMKDAFSCDTNTVLCVNNVDRTTIKCSELKRSIFSLYIFT